MQNKEKNYYKIPQGNFEEYQADMNEQNSGEN